MSLLAAVEAELPALRAQAEALMVDACTILAPGDELTYDPDTGRMWVIWRESYRYSGPMKPTTVFTSNGR